MKRFLFFSLAMLIAVTVALPTHAQTQPFVYFVPPGECSTVVSGNSTGTNGQTTAGASNTPVVQAQTSNSGTNTHTYTCNITPPATLSGNSAVWRILDAVFLYGVQTTDLDTQVASGSAGTLNSTILFNAINYPTSGASETPSTVAPVRADAGTLVMTPAVGSFNVATTTAGAFYSQKFAPPAPITWNSDLKQLSLKVTLLCQATSATITNSPGVFVHIQTF